MDILFTIGKIVGAVAAFFLFWGTFYFFLSRLGYLAGYRPPGQDGQKPTGSAAGRNPTD